VGVIKHLGRQQHASPYHIEFGFKKMMLPIAEVMPLIIDEYTGVGAPTDENDSNRTSCLLHRVPDSEQRVFPDSDDGGINVDLSNEEDCVKSIAGADNFTWNRQKQGEFTFTDQDNEDDVPSLADDEVTKDLTLEWVEEGNLPKPTDKMKDSPCCLRKGCEKNFRSPVMSFISTLPLILWEVSIG
jgi:hypothetical protein